MTDDAPDYVRDYLWLMADEIPGLDKNIWRSARGWVIRWKDYGDRTSRFGWEKDHHVPTILGGLDVLGNYRPMHWAENVWLGSVAKAVKASDVPRGMQPDTYINLVEAVTGISTWPPTPPTPGLLPPGLLG